MKTTLILLLSICLISKSQAQTIRRVNNNFGVSGINVYATAQAAHDAATANDILIIDPSDVTYGDLTLTKPLKIYGNGYHLGVNKELKADTRSSIVSDIYFDSGSDGSEIYGLYGSQFYIYGVSNITISRCKFSNLYFRNNDKADFVSSNISNLLCLGNYFTTTSITAKTGYTITSVIFTNNIMSGLSANYVPHVQNWVVSNNTFRSSPINLTSAVFDNNLLVNGGVPSFSNVSASYNVSRDDSFSGGIGNQNNFNITPNLVGSGTGISQDAEYQLIGGSALLTAGNGGIEVGAYGGDTPYIISGIPAIPSIAEMSISSTGSDANPLDVVISIKSNN